jgi:hypothetical protein
MSIYLPSALSSTMVDTTASYPQGTDYGDKDYTSAYTRNKQNPWRTGQIAKKMSGIPPTTIELNPGGTVYWQIPLSFYYGTEISGDNVRRIDRENTLYYYELSWPEGNPFPTALRE